MVTEGLGMRLDVHARLAVPVFTQVWKTTITSRCRPTPRLPVIATYEL